MRGNVIARYDFRAANGDQIPDLSGNGYLAFNRGCKVVNDVVIYDGVCYLSTPLKAKGRPYSLTFSVKPASHGGTLFGSEEQHLSAGNGSSSNIAFIANGNAYDLNFTLPLYQ